MFLKEVSNGQQGCIYLVKNDQRNKYCKILLYIIINVFYFNTFYNVIYSSDSKGEFSAYLFQYPVSHFIFDVKSSCAIQYICKEK